MISTLWSLIHSKSPHPSSLVSANRFPLLSFSAFFAFLSSLLLTNCLDQLGASKTAVESGRWTGIRYDVCQSGAPLGAGTR